MDSKLRNKIIFNSLHNKFLLSDRDNHRIRVVFLIVLLVSSWVLSQAVRINAEHDEGLQEGIAKEIIRFHVIANSDSDEDQYLKYQLKEIGRASCRERV